MSKSPNRPLMPTATAVWLIDNTSLTFEQIANFCELHKLEVEGIANEDVAHGVKGFDPIASGQLAMETIEQCQKDSSLALTLDEQARKAANPTPPKGRKQPRYTPISRRRDRPDAIAWLLRNHPEINDGQVGRLIGTTKSTISTVRNRTHWNSQSIKPVDPVSLGLCSQKALDEVVTVAGERKERRENEKRRALKRAAKLAQDGEADAATAVAAAAEPVAAVDPLTAAEPVAAADPLTDPDPVAAADPAPADPDPAPADPPAEAIEDDVAEDNG